ncbi:MAG: ketosamine-3-kinase [Saprospiraceae bacterium]|nr:MAG: ketosamine-3-kinase [Saprospiraceae bacterium]
MFFDLPPSVILQCSDILDAGILTAQLTSGGDINQACLLETTRGKFFLKMNTGTAAGRMFATEAKGLQLLAKSGALRVPEVIGLGQNAGHAFLLLEYLEPGYRPPGFWEEFGAALAALHRSSAPRFGLDQDNFIGSLPQSNARHDNWPSFFTSERLQPQVVLALHGQQLITADAQNFERLYKKLPEICPEEPPALIHGDLWSGNFMCDTHGNPVLFDPAVSYSHREMDLAMSRLFGGFDRQFYRSYEEAWPLAPGFGQRLPVYQLYYLLVHVNLFGGSYAGSVRSILQQFV